MLSIRPPSEEHLASVQVTKPVVDLITSQSPGKSSATACREHSVLTAVLSCALAIKKHKLARHQADLEKVQQLKSESLLPQQQALLSIAGEKGVSSWLTSDPALDEGTTLNKSDFRDAICLRYGFPLDGIPLTCVCGQAFSVDHAMTCPCGGYPSARHDEVRDVLADAMRSVFREVETEPQLLPYAEKDLSGKTANRAPEARLDLKVKSFWTRDQAAFFDVRVTHPKSSLQTLPELQRQLERNEREKKRQYCQRVNLIDRGVFTPLVFTTNGLVGQECNRCLKRSSSA